MSGVFYDDLVSMAIVPRAICISREGPDQKIMCQAREGYAKANLPISEGTSFGFTWGRR